MTCIAESRDALAKALAEIGGYRGDNVPDWPERVVRALERRGAVVAADALADDEALVERVCELMGLDPEFGAMDVSHVLSKTNEALSERGQR